MHNRVDCPKAPVALILFRVTYIFPAEERCSCLYAHAQTCIHDIQSRLDYFGLFKLKQIAHFEKMSMYGFIDFATPAVACQQLKVGIWLQLYDMSLGYNALEGTLPDSWKLNKVT